MEKVCIVAILKDEESFLDEWIIYHRMLGIDYFYLYDDDPELPLQDFLKPYKEFVTVVNWYSINSNRQIGNQVNAYKHALRNYCINYDWVAFIDGDEFMVLRKHESIKSFLNEYKPFSSISLNWHTFGHNGFYEDPEGLITASLTRRMYLPDKDVKSISRPEAIQEIDYPHYFKCKGMHVDVNKKIFNENLYPGRTDVAHINHYQCRSFRSWMNRVKRGDVNFSAQNYAEIHKWRLKDEECLKQFVTDIAKNKNEYVDEYMLKYKGCIEKHMKL